MKKPILGLFIVILSVQWSFAQDSTTEQEIIDLSKDKWQWMSDKNVDIHEVSVNIIDNTAILLNRIDLLAEVGGNEVTNPFEVTEVYVKQDGHWKLGSLSFTRLMTRGEE